MLIIAWEWRTIALAIRKGKEEFQLHDEIKKQQAALVDKQRREVKQFLVIVNGKTSIQVVSDFNVR